MGRRVERAFAALLEEQAAKPDGVNFVRCVLECHDRYVMDLERVIVTYRAINPPLASRLRSRANKLKCKYDSVKHVLKATERSMAGWNTDQKTE